MTNLDKNLVVPTDLGNTFKQEGDKYQVNVGKGLTVKPDGTIELALSPDEGNLLQLRGNGSYYGIKPPPNLESLYVDAVNGVDQHPDQVQGAGTKDKPLRTLKYASDLAIFGTVRNIFLKCNQDHVVDTWFRVTAGTLKIRMYGEELDEEYIRQGNELGNAYYQIMLKKLEPRIVFRGIDNSRMYPEATKEKTVISLVKIEVDPNTILDISNVRLVNDLDAVIRRNPQATTNYCSLAHYNRIELIGNAQLTLQSVRLESTGNVTIDQDVTNITEGNLTFTVKGLQQSSFGITHMSTGSIQFRGMFIEEPYPYSICGVDGWYYGLAAGAVMSLKHSGNGNQEKIAKRIYGVQSEEQNGVKVLLNLNTDVSSLLFN